MALTLLPYEHIQPASGNLCDTLPNDADVSVCSVLTYVQRITGFTTMHYINLHFTYLLYVNNTWKSSALPM